MKILVTGGAGFIGSGVALKLAALGHELTVLDSLSPQIHGHDPQAESPLYRSILGKVRFVRGSVCDREALCEVLSDQEAIVHMAAETGTGQSMYEIERYTDVNVRGTGLMLELVAKQFRSVQKIVLASSRAVYGEGKYWSEAAGIVYPESRREADMAQGCFDILWSDRRERLTPMATDEDSLLHPNSIYGVTKQSQEQLLSVTAQALGVSYVVLRYQNVYGPGQSLGNPYTGVLSVFSVRLLNKNRIEIYEDGEETRDFVYIEDVIDATVAALLDDAVRNVVIGVGSGVPTSIMTVAQTLARLYEVNVPIDVTGAYRVGDIRHNFADLTRARSLLALRPRYDISSGLAKFVRWVKKQGVGDDRYERSIQEMKAHGLFRS